MTSPPFPFGLQPEVEGAFLDPRGPDTMNRLLLHGARYHDRKSVFVSSEWGEMPDWRADRLSIRLALALREERGVGPGDLVGLLIPLSVRWALLERAVWGLGAVTLPLSPESRLDGKVKVVFRSSELDSHWDALLERGGVLDTPERASSFRASAREVSPAAVASIESGVELRQGDWVRRIERFLARFPPGRGGRHVLDISEPHIEARTLVYAGWADGFTTVVLGAGEGESDSGSGSRRFANLAALEETFDG